MKTICRKVIFAKFNHVQISCVYEICSTYSYNLCITSVKYKITVRIYKAKCKKII